MFAGPSKQSFRQDARSSLSSIMAIQAALSGSESDSFVGQIAASGTVSFVYNYSTPSSNTGFIIHNPPPSINDNMGRPLEVTFDSKAGFTPVVGQDISMDLGPGPLFQGTAVKVTASYLSKQANPIWKTVLSDYTYLFNKYRPFGKWVNTSASTVASYLVTCFAPGFNTGGVQGGLPLINLTLDGTAPLAEVFAQIAKKINGSFRLNGKTVQLYTINTYQSPTPVTDANILNQAAVQYTQDTTQIRTRVWVKSGKVTTVAADIPAGATKIPLTDITQVPSSGKLLIDGQIINYSGTNVTKVVDDGTHPGPGSGAPIVSQSNTNNGPTYAAGTYRVWVTWLYPDGFETAPSGYSTVTLDGTHALQFTNLQTPNTAGVKIKVYASQDSDKGKDGSVGLITTITPPFTNAGTSGINMTAKSGGTGAFTFLYYPQTDQATFLVFGGNIGAHQWQQFTTDPAFGGFVNLGNNSPNITFQQIPPGFTVLTATLQLTGGAPTWVNGSTVPNSTATTFWASVFGRRWSSRTQAILLSGSVFNNPDGTSPKYPSGVSAFNLEGEIFQVETTIDCSNCPGPQQFGYTFPAPKVTGTYNLLVWNGKLPKGTIANARKLKVGDTSNFCATGGQAAIGGKIINYTGIDSANSMLTGISFSGTGSIGCCPVTPGNGISPYNNACDTTPPGGNSNINNGYGTGNSPDDGTTPFGGLTASGLNPTGADASNSNGSIIGVTSGACNASGILPISKGAAVQLFVQVDDAAAIADCAAREGGNGIHESIVDAPQAITLNDCYNAGMIELTLFGYPIQTIVYDTHDQLSASGKMVQINLTVPSVSGNFRIQSVQVNDIAQSPGSNLAPRFKVTASSVRYDLQDLLNRIILRGAL